MSKLACLAAAALVVAVPPRLAHAEGPPPASIKVYCQPGSLNNCFAFAIVSDNGHVTYWLQNLQGTLAGGGAQFDLRNILVQNAGSVAGSPTVQYIPVMASGVQGTVCQSVSFEGAVLRGTDCFGEESSASPHLQKLYTTFGAGIVGCTLPAPELTFFVAQTCPANGQTGWVRFDAMAALLGPTGPTGPASVEDLFVSVQGCDVFAGASSGFSITNSCATTIDYADVTAKFTTVPEPTSIALLGSGLLGTGVFGTLRPRRKRA